MLNASSTEQEGTPSQETIPSKRRIPWWATLLAVLGITGGAAVAETLSEAGTLYPHPFNEDQRKAYTLLGDPKVPKLQFEVIDDEENSTNGGVNLREKPFVGNPGEPEKILKKLPVGKILSGKYFAGTDPTDPTGRQRDGSWVTFLDDQTGIVEFAASSRLKELPLNKPVNISSTTSSTNTEAIPTSTAYPTATPNPKGPK